MCMASSTDMIAIEAMAPLWHGDRDLRHLAERLGHPLQLVIQGFVRQPRRDRVCALNHVLNARDRETACELYGR